MQPEKPEPAKVQMSSFWKMVAAEVTRRTREEYKNHNYIRDLHNGNAFNNTISETVEECVEWALKTLADANMEPRYKVNAKTA